MGYSFSSIGELGDEHGAARERRQRTAVVAVGEGELRDAEQQPLVLGAEGPHLHLAVRHSEAGC